MTCYPDWAFWVFLGSIVSLLMLNTTLLFLWMNASEKAAVHSHAWPPVPEDEI